MANFLEKYAGILRWLVLLTVFLVVVHASVKIIKSPFSKGDFEAFFNAAELIVNRQNIYLTPTRDVSQGGLFYLYLPLLALMLVPLTLLSLPASILLWNFLSAFLIFWTTKAFYKMLSGDSFSELPIRSRWAAAFFPILFTSPFILHHLAYGQANILILAVTTLAIKLIANRRDTTGGTFLGLAIVLKVIAAPFVIWFVSRKCWRVVAGVTVGIIIGMVLIPSLFLGMDLNVSYVDYWVRIIVLADDLGTAKVPLGVNLSLQAQMFRFFTEMPAFNYKQQTYSLTIYSLQPQTIKMIGRLLQVLVLSTIVFYAVRYKNRAELISKWGGIALTFALVPLFATTAQRHYFVMLLPAYVYAVYVWHRLKFKDKWFRFLLAASFVFTLISTDGITGGFLSDFFTAAGCVAWGTISLVLCIFRVANRLGDEEILEQSLQKPNASESGRLSKSVR